MGLVSQSIEIISSLKPSWVQALSTVVLAIITLYYAQIIKSQVKNERRQDHSETLRDSLSDWLESLAPVGKVYAKVIDKDLRLLPERAEEDPYVADFKNNHAIDISNDIDEISDLIDEFDDKYKQYLEATESMSASQFSAQIDLPSEIDIQEVIFYFGMASRDDFDVGGANDYIDSSDKPRVTIQFPPVLFSDNSYSSTIDVTDQGNYDHIPRGYNYQTSVAGDFQNEIETAVENLSEENKCLLNNCYDHLHEIVEKYGSFIRKLDAYKKMALYPGYCVFIGYNPKILPLKQWVFKVSYDGIDESD